MDNSGWDTLMMIRSMAQDVHTAEASRALVLTSGPAAAHVALTLVDLALERMMAKLHNGTPDEAEMFEELAIVDAALQAWKTLYSFRGV